MSNNTSRTLEPELTRLTRRELAKLCGGAAIAVTNVMRPTPVTASDSTFTATELNHIALRVSNVERSTEFYRRHLGMEVVLDRPFAKFLGCGPHFVALFAGGRPGLDHFSVTLPGYDQSAVVERLRAVGLEPELEQNRTYFHDPDGIKIQVESPIAWPGPGPRPGQPG